jgi:MULE transposase domain
VWFALSTQVNFARRFISSFTYIIDGTFSINTLNLILIVVYGVINTNKTFLVCLLFARSESKVLFDFIFGCMKDLIFAGQNSASLLCEAEPGNNIRSNQRSPFPKVVISD